MTDNEIIKALECCANNGDCKECAINPHKGNYGYCTSLAIKAALDLINRQKAEIENLNKDLSDTIALNYKERQELKTKIEEQRFVISCMETGRVILERQRKNVWDTAIRKFAERLKENFIGFSRPNNLLAIRDSIDNLVKEMVGDV